MDQLSKSAARLQTVTECSQAPRARSYSLHPQNQPSRANSVICQQPGHFARDCDGERVPPRPRAASPVAGFGGFGAQQSEN